MIFMANYRANYTTQEKKAFAERLRKLMLEHHMAGADLARRVGTRLGRPFARQTVSSYLTGISIPEEATLQAIAEVLNVPSSILVPRPHRQAPGEPPPVDPAPTRDVRMTLIGGGKMALMLNVEVEQETGWKILELLKEAGH
jgi:transcriptional regulator with XRE-family HTH domain